MIEIVGDFWDEARNRFCDVLVCTTNQTLKSNGELVMGAGIAKGFAYIYPFLPKEWGDRVSRGHLWTMATHMFRRYAHEDYVVALPTKTNWKIPSNIDLVLRSCKELRLLADYLDWKKILMTRPGCGNGGLKWEEVKEKISPYLDDRFIVINKE